MGLCSFRGIGMASAPVLSKQPSERLEGAPVGTGGIGALRPLLRHGAAEMRIRPGFGRPLFVSQRSISATVANNRAPQNATEAAIAAMIALMVWWDDRDVGAVCRKGPTPELRALEPVPFCDLGLRCCLGRTGVVGT